MRFLVPVVTLSAALGLAGCMTSPVAQSSGGSSAPSAATSASPAASPAGTPADRQACRRLEAYPSPPTVAAARKYATFLVRQGKLSGLSPALAGQLEATAADLTASLNGTDNRQQIGADANKLQSICADYGVTS